MSLFDHIGFESRNIPVSHQFYARCLAPLALRVVQTNDDVFFISGDVRNPLPFLRVVASQATPEENSDFAPDKHLHLKFRAANHAQVVAFYQAALASGGRDSAAPGYQGPKEMAYFAALVFDPDGNTIEVGVHG